MAPLSSRSVNDQLFSVPSYTFLIFRMKIHSKHKSSQCTKHPRLKSNTKREGPRLVTFNNCRAEFVLGRSQKRLFASQASVLCNDTPN